MVKAASSRRGGSYGEGIATPPFLSLSLSLSLSCFASPLNSGQFTKSERVHKFFPLGVELILEGVSSSKGANRQS